MIGELVGLLMSNHMDTGTIPDKGILCIKSTITLLEWMLFLRAKNNHATKVTLTQNE
jgi:hypothetical protein